MADQLSRQGESYFTPAIREYAENLHAPHDAALRDALACLERENLPRIQISPMEGRILQMLMTLVGARKVAEFGTLSGYSALWMLKGMGPGGQLWTCELDPRHADVARGVFHRAGYGKQATVVVGEGLASTAKLAAHAPFDAVFIDADKVNYANYARWAFDHLRPGGLIMGDNAYLFGYLAGRGPDESRSQAAIDGMRGFHEFLAARCLSVCIPTPDGLAVGMKPL